MMLRVEISWWKRNFGELRLFQAYLYPEDKAESTTSTKYMDRIHHHTNAKTTHTRI